MMMKKKSNLTHFLGETKDQQTLTFPPDWTERYRSYMLRNDVPFKEAKFDGQTAFVLPLKYRPHAWQRL